MPSNPSSVAATERDPVLLGVDHALRDLRRFRGRIGFVTNDAARISSGETSSRAALQHAGFNLVRIFSPEHGISAALADGIAVSDSLDGQTGLPVVSLYGDRLKPAPEQLRDLDAVWFDVPDIGSRFYTYIWTLWHALEACGQAGKPLVVLDRPNPLGGEISIAEGPMLDVEHCSSFLGRSAVPIRHSLTAGELAQLWKKELNIEIDLQIVRCANWRRSMHWPDTRLPFVRTSPAMPCYESALLYCGTCLFEATNLSVGRSLSFPFQVIGAPWMQPERVIEQLPRDIAARPCEFRPAIGPHAGTQCRGIRLQPARNIRPVRIGLHLLAATIATHRNEFSWAPYPSSANPSGQRHFEMLVGQRGIREELEKPGEDIDLQIARWTATSGWRERTAGILLYE